jgi:cytochrome c-type biogenesis protein CcmH
VILFWVFAALLTVGVLTLLLRPLLRPVAAEIDAATQSQRVYADQIAEIERDTARGLLNSDQAKAAWSEIGRRLLATGAAPTAVTQSASTTSPRLALGLTLLLPAATLGLYLYLGQPGLPGQPLAQRQNAQAAPDHIVQAAASLAARLEQEPDNLEGWALLGGTYAAMSRHADAAEAYRRATVLRPGDATLLGAYGEQLVLQAEGAVTPQAVSVFEAAVAADPGNARARYYLGAAREQAGDLQGAISAWVAILRDSPAGAPWVGPIQRRVTEAAESLGLDPATILPTPTAPAPAPSMAVAPSGAGSPLGSSGAAAPLLSPEQMQAMASMSPEERQQTIRSMVDGLSARLEESGGDVDGWLRLARARTVLGEKAAAEAALRRALTLDPDNRQALWQLGSAAADAGRQDEARTLLTRLLKSLPESSAERADVAKRLEALK